MTDTDPVRALLDELRPGARRLLQRVTTPDVIADIHTALERYEPAELARLITHGGIAGIANGAALMKHRLRRYAGRELPDAMGELDQNEAHGDAYRSARINSPLGDE